MWPWSLALVAAGCVVSVLAPGNAARAAEHPQGGDVLLTLRYLGLDGLRATRAWVLEPKCLGLTLLLWMSLPFRAPRPRWIRPGVNWPALVAVTGLAALAIGLAGPRWAIHHTARRRLRAVVTEIANTAIHTIHGFCHRVLIDDAFAAQRMFSQTQVADEVAFYTAFGALLRERFARRRHSGLAQRRQRFGDVSQRPRRRPDEQNGAS